MRVRSPSSGFQPATVGGPLRSRRSRHRRFLAAIGYHFGSKDRLLTEAFTEESGRAIGDDFESRIRVTAGQSVAAAFPQVWAGIADLFAQNADVLAASVENFVRIHRTPSEQSLMSKVHDSAVSEIATTLEQTYPDLDPTRVRAVGELYIVLLNGLALQWISNPDAPLPSGADLAAAITALVGR